MKLVFTHGPPASGKLTVAKELAKLTGFKLFDNHVSICFVQSIFDFGTKPFFQLVDKCRTDMIEQGAKERVDIIFTFVYEKVAEDSFIRKILSTVNRHGGKVFFVRLQWRRPNSKDVLAARLAHLLGSCPAKDCYGQSSGNTILATNFHSDQAWR